MSGTLKMRKNPGPTSLRSLARMLANWLQNSHPEELTMYILSLTVRSQTAFKLKLREKPLPFKPSGGVALVERQKMAVEMAVVVITP